MRFDHKIYLVYCYSAKLSNREKLKLMVKTVYTYYLYLGFTVNVMSGSLTEVVIAIQCDI